MPISPTKSYQIEIAQLLTHIYPSTIPIEVEWCAIQNIQKLYSPRIDIAVGPFSVVRGGNCIKEYDRLMDLSVTFIERILEFHRQNIQEYRVDDEQLNNALKIPSFKRLKTFNKNARCLLAIEIENKVSHKHLLGGTVNAAALGRLGIAVGWTEDKVKAFVRLQTYWDFLYSVGKNTFYTRNLVILSPEQLRGAILSSNVIN